MGEYRASILSKGRRLGMSFPRTVSFSVVSGRSTCNRPDPPSEPRLRPEPEAGPYRLRRADYRRRARARAPVACTVGVARAVPEDSPWLSCANTLSATTPTSLLRLCKRSRLALHGLRIGKDDSRTRTRARAHAPPFFFKIPGLTVTVVRAPCRAHWHTLDDLKV